MALQHEPRTDNSSLINDSGDLLPDRMLSVRRLQRHEQSIAHLTVESDASIVPRYAALSNTEKIFKSPLRKRAHHIPER